PAQRAASRLTPGFPYGIRETRDTNSPEYAAFAVRCRGVRRMGSAVLDLAWVAAGRFDGFWELRLGTWDVAAGGGPGRGGGGGGGGTARRGGRRSAAGRSTSRRRPSSPAMVASTTRSSAC